MAAILPTRSLGRNGPQVTALGFGLMGMSAFYGPPMKDEDAFPLLDRSIELGCTFWDTSNIYGGNEEMLGRYFKARPGVREKIFLATKFGAGHDSKSGKFTERGDPEYVVQCAETSLSRLGVSYIDLYYIHRVDRSVPIEVTMKALVQLKQQGKIHHIGISEASSDTLRRAHAVHPLAAHQVEYSPFELSIEHEDIEVLKTCRELGIAVVAYSPLGRGMITGKIRSPDEFDPTDFRRTLPRFQPDTFPKNLAIVDTVSEIAKRHNATAGQLALAWLLAQGNEVIPIPGTTRAIALEENVRALEIVLSAKELEELSSIIRAADVQGDRYADDMIHQVYADTMPLSQ